MKSSKKYDPYCRNTELKKPVYLVQLLGGEAQTNDIDLLVKIDKKISLLDLVGIQQGLEDELNMKVDLVEYDSLKPALKEDILKEEVSVL